MPLQDRRKEGSGECLDKSSGCDLNYAINMITSAKLRTPSAKLRDKLSWMPLQDRKKIKIVTKVHSCLHGEAPEYLCSKFKKNPNAELRETRGVDNLRLLYPHTSLYRNSFEVIMVHTFGTKSLVSSRKSDIREHSSMLYGSICFTLYELVHTFLFLFIYLFI